MTTIDGKYFIKDGHESPLYEKCLVSREKITKATNLDNLPTFEKLLEDVREECPAIGLDPDIDPCPYCGAASNEVCQYDPSKPRGFI